MTASTTDFVAQHGITLDSSTELGPRIDGPLTYWFHSVRMSHNGNALTTEFSFGNPNDRPNVAEALDALVTDGWPAHLAGTFDEWCSVYDKDTDSPAALADYKRCATIWPQVCEFLGAWLAEDLAENYQRL